MKHICTSSISSPHPSFCLCRSLESIQFSEFQVPPEIIYRERGVRMPEIKANGKDDSFYLCNCCGTKLRLGADECPECESGLLTFIYVPTPSGYLTEVAALRARKKEEIRLKTEAKAARMELKLHNRGVKRGHRQVSQQRRKGGGGSHAVMPKTTPAQLAGEATSFIANFNVFANMLKGSISGEEQARKRIKISKVAFQRSPGIDFLALQQLCEIRNNLQESLNGRPTQSCVLATGLKAALRSKQGGQEWSVSDLGLRLGRCTEAWGDVDVKLSTMKASKVHAEILLDQAPVGEDVAEGLKSDATGYVIHCLGRNGLTVDGERIHGGGSSVTPTSKRLKHGSLIQIGEQAFEFVVAS